MSSIINRTVFDLPIIVGVDEELPMSVDVSDKGDVSVSVGSPRKIEVMTIPEVAAMLKLHRKTVYLLTKKGKLPGFRVGNAWRFNKQDVLEMISKKV